MAYAVRICPPPGPPRLVAETCPANPRIEHEPWPRGFMESLDLFERMAETHEQRQCPGCGKWAVWVELDGLGLA